MSIITSERIAQIDAQIAAHWKRINALQLGVAKLEDLRAELLKAPEIDCPHRRAGEIMDIPT